MRAPSSKGEGRHLLDMTVKAAIESATATGNLDMANAIQQMYESSLSDPALAELMDIVLAHKATPDQHQQFRAVMKKFRDLNARFAKPRDPAEEAAAAAAAEAERGRLGSMTNPVLVDDMQSRPSTPQPRFRLDPNIEVVQLSSSDEESEDSSDDDSAMNVEMDGFEHGGHHQRHGETDDDSDSDSDSDTSSQASLEIIYDSRREGAPRTLGYPDHIPRPRTKSRTPTEPEPYKNRYGLRDRDGALVGSRGSDDWILRPPKTVNWTPDYSHGDSLKRKRIARMGRRDANVAGRGNFHRQEISTPLVGNIKALKAKLGSVPNSKTVPGRHILSIVVDGCMRRSGAEGNPAVGEAIRMFYDESLSDPSLAEFLDELFAGKATKQQVHRFQTYVRDHLQKAGAEIVQPAKSTVSVNGIQSPAGVFVKPMTPVEAEGITPVIITVGERGSLNRGPPEPEFETVIIHQPPVVITEVAPIEKATPDLGKSSTPPPAQSGVVDTGVVGDGTSMSPPGLATGIDWQSGSSNGDPPLPSFSFAHVPETSSVRDSAESLLSTPSLITPIGETLGLIGPPYLLPRAGSSLDVSPSPTASTSTLVDSDMTEV